MKRAIFRSVLACLCVYATFSGFSSKSLADEKVKGFVISSESETKTIEKVNNRILDNTKGSASKISYVVNIDDKISFSLAGLLSLDKGGVVIPVKDNNIDDTSKAILKNSEQVYVVGDKSSISDDILNDLGIKFNRIGSDNPEDTNYHVNKFLGNRDLLAVDSGNDSDILGAVHYARIYNMNLYIYDSTKQIDENIISEVKNEKKAEYKKITSDEAKNIMLTEKPIVVDVRSLEEYNEGHIPNAISVPLETIENEAETKLKNKDDLILVYCRSGRRSREAALRLIEKGYTNVIDFGGIQDWNGEVVK